MNDTALQATLREMHALLTHRITLAVLLGLSLVFGLSGPFDTYAAMPLAPRLLYWLIVVCSTFAIGMASGKLASHLAPLPGLHPLVAAVLSGAIGSVPVTLIVLFINWASFGDLAIAPIHLFLYCLVICAAVSGLLSLLATQPPPAPANPLDPAAPKTAPIYQRLKLPQRGNLLALSVADHYVEIVTDKGRALVLMRLGDAIAETTPIPGFQIHRSHWVAQTAIVKTLRVNARPMVELRDGTRLPISRSFAPALRAAGLLN